MKKITWSLRLGIILVAGLLLACGKKEEKPGTDGATPIPKLQIPADRLLGLTFNGQAADHLARQSGDPMLLESSDLAQFFQFFQLDYLEKVLKLAQSQIDTGKPLKGINLYFGAVPKKYAAKCAQDLAGSTCLVEPVAFDCNEALPQKNWTDENYAKICMSVGRLKALNPQLLVAAFDGDNTVWYQDMSNAGVKRGVESGKIAWGDAKAELLAVYPPPEARRDYKLKTTPYQYYEELYEKAGALFNYEFAALAFRGLTLNEAYAIFKEALEQKYHPIPFPEMTDLIRYLNQQGVLTGIVSASPNFSVYPLAETLQTGIPLENIEGLDVFVRNPTDAAALPVRLSRLLLQGKMNEATGQVDRFNTYQDFLATYGTWVIADVDHIVNARAGKAIAVRSLARRLAAKNNLNPGQAANLLDVDDLRMFLIGGDNFAPFTDLPNPKGERIKAAQEAGNDQGLSEGLDFLEKGENSLGGTDILYIRRYVLEADQKAYPKKGGLEKFQAYFDQEKLVRPTRVGNAFVQPAVTDVKLESGKGGFLKETPQTSETQPTPETAPAVTPKPLSTPLPLASPPPSGASPAPVRPFGPLPQEPMAPPAALPPPPAATPAAAAPPAALPPKLEPLPPGPPSDAL
jgi:hypothetical protein